MQSDRASKRQQELLSFVDGFIKGNGYGPSYREIMRALGYKSVSTVAIHVEGLITKGYLARRDKSARSLEVVTLRSPDPTVKDELKIDIEAELINRTKATELSDEQRATAKQVFEWLGLTMAAAALSDTERSK